MRAIEIAVKDVKIVARDYKALALIIAMPLVLVMILGAALGPMFSRQDRVNPFHVAVVDLDRGQVSSLFMEVINSDQVAALLKVRVAASEDEARELVRKRNVTCAIVIPEGASDVSGLSASQFTVLGDPGEPIRGQIVRSIVSSFAEQYSVVVAGASSVVEEVMRASGPFPGAAEFAEGVVHSLADVTTGAAGLFTKSEQGAEWITSLQYYTASMTVMFVMFGAMLGVKSILEEKQAGTMGRLFTTKATSREVMVGKTLATFAISFLQILVLVLFTRYVYKVSWGPSMLDAIAVSAVVAFAATGFAMLLAALSKTEKMADAVENIGVQVMAFLGGCQYPIYAFPKAMHTISKFTLTRWSLDSYLAIMDGQGLAGVATPLGVLAAMGLGFLAIGIWRLRLD